MKPEQIDALKKEGYDSGFAAGQAAGHDAQTAQLASVLSAVDAHIDALMRNLTAIARDQEQNSRLLALAIAKKIMPAAAAANGLTEIEALLNEALRDMAREPRLVVRVHEAEFDAVNERVQAIASQRAYAGKVIVLADEDVRSGDVRVEWADGGVERNAQQTWRAIEQTINPSA